MSVVGGLRRPSVRCAECGEDLHAMTGHDDLMVNEVTFAVWWCMPCGLWLSVVNGIAWANVDAAHGPEVIDFAGTYRPTGER